MKHFKILILLIAFAFSKAQSPYFDRYYKLGYTLGAVQNLLKLKDSSYIAYATVNDSATGRKDCGFFKMDKHGDEVSKRVINFQNVHYALQDKVYTDMVQINSSSFIKLGMNFYSSNPISMILSKISTTTLDTLQNKYFSDAYHYYSYGILKLHSNKFFLIGTKTNTATNDYWPNLIEMDSSFNFTASYDVPLTNTILITDAKLNESNKKIILSGYAPSTNSHAALITIDTLGNYINHVIDSSSSITNYSQVLFSGYDNTYVTFGLKKTGSVGNNNLYRLYICKYSATSLLPIWKKTYGTAQYINNLYDAVINMDGSILTSGRYADSVSVMAYANCNTNGVLLKINTNGDSLWMRQYDNHGLQPPNMPWDEMFKGIERTRDGGYIACGLPYYKPDPKLWVIRVDSMGCFNTSCTPSNIGLNELKLDEFVKIYPNPASSFLIVESLNNDAEEIQIEDINGRMILKHSLSAGNTIDVSSFPNGVYAITLKNKGNSQSTKRFMISH